MKRPIRIYGDPILEQVCAEVKDFTASAVKDLVRDLLDTCQATENSAGLAAPQIGVALRIAVVRTDFLHDDTDNYVVLINPRIVSQSGRSEEKEGCLSIPGHWDKMTRSETITVQYQDQSGTVQTIKGTGILARAFAHEIDHLDGRLFIHYFGGAYCAAVKEWLGRHGKEPIEKEPATSTHAPQEIQSVPAAEEISSLPEASFVQAQRPEDQLNDDTTDEMADREN